MNTEVLWKMFWDQLSDKKHILTIDRSTLFHYVVLEFLGYSPSKKISEGEKRRIREMDKESKECIKLFDLYRKRVYEYIN